LAPEISIARARRLISAIVPGAFDKRRKPQPIRPAAARDFLRFLFARQLVV
jgi:hypothetical protein